MSINVSYNKRMGIHYVYEITYEWDEEKQKKVTRKHCIGHLDPVTGEIKPNGRRGRHRFDPQAEKRSVAKPDQAVMSSERKCDEASLMEIKESLKHIEEMLAVLIGDLPAKCGKGIIKGNSNSGGQVKGT